MQIEQLFPFATNLDEKVVNLLGEVMQAHSCAASINPNASTAAAVNSYLGSRSINQAICSAILATGKVHGPVTDARLLFGSVDFGHDPLTAIDIYLENGAMVPGFGNSFYKDRIDPCWDHVVNTLMVDFPEEWEVILQLQRALESRKKLLHPNAALFTGATACIAGFPVGTEPSLFIIPRIGAWVQASIK